MQVFLLSHEVREEQFIFLSIMVMFMKLIVQVLLNVSGLP